jgi:hypothetical protein
VSDSVEKRFKTGDDGDDDDDDLSFLTYLKLDIIICEWLTFIDASGDRETEFLL